MKSNFPTDRAVLLQIGGRLAMRRIAAGLTQAALARQAGVGRSTVERLEAGQSTQMSSFVRVLRALDLLEHFVDLLPEPGVSPMQLLAGQRKRRQRASSRQRPTGKAAAGWTWDDDA